MTDISAVFVDLRRQPRGVGVATISPDNEGAVWHDIAPDTGIIDSLLRLVGLDRTSRGEIALSPEAIWRRFHFRQEAPNDRLAPGDGLQQAAAQEWAEACGEAGSRFFVKQSVERHDLRAEHVHRQNTPVEVTPTRARPFQVGSRYERARQSS